jgi:hypothetical protein
MCHTNTTSGSAHRCSGSTVRPPVHGPRPAVVADLQHLFGTPGWIELATLPPERQLPFLGYTESFPDLIDNFA